MRDIFCVKGKVEYVKAGWKPGYDYMVPIRRVCTLKAPLDFGALRTNPHLKDAGFVRGCMQGRPRATEYWFIIFIGRSKCCNSNCFHVQATVACQSSLVADNGRISPQIRTHLVTVVQMFLVR